ncbi:MAG: protein translocase subunit SecD [Parcubacteria group bacterium]|nr:protein translocase subunit SecD [Parcubacteria group bacterium]
MFFWKMRLIAALLLLLGIAAGYFDAGGLGNRFSYHLGLDLAGGTHLVYRADTSALPDGQTTEAMEGLRDTIERRVNFFGVTEPVVQAQQSGDEDRLIVELAGVTDIDQAVALIGQTPFLEFRVDRPEEERRALEEALQSPETASGVTADQLFEQTPLTGRFLKRASLQFDNTTGLQPAVALEFNEDGKKLLADITQEHLKERLAIYLDGIPIQVAVVQDVITSGNAQITGTFSAKEARDLVRALNSGALPLPIELIAQQRVGAALGADALSRGIRAGFYGILAIMIFLLLWYRVPGVLAVLALGIYGVLILALFKFIPVTLTAAGIAGFILSIGMAVDANILIFERMKEELRDGKMALIATREGFFRAWPSIRDSNITSLISAAILFQFGTSIVRGFALTLGLGILVSMFSAITATRTFLFALGARERHGVLWLSRRPVEAASTAKTL